MSTTSTRNADSTTPAPPILDARLADAAVLCAVSLSAFALADAAVRGTGGTPPWDDTTGTAPAVAAGMALHSLSYLVFAAVLVAGALQIDGGRPVLGAAFAGLTLSSVAGASAPVALEAAAGIGFAAMFLSAFGLGVVLGRQRHTRLPRALLLSIPVLIGLTAVAGVLAPGWTHPAYTETGLYAAIATLALVCRRPSSPPQGS